MIAGSTTVSLLGNTTSNVLMTLAILVLFFAFALFLLHGERVVSCSKQLEAAVHGSVIDKECL